MKRVFKTSLAALLLSVSVQSMAAFEWVDDKVSQVYIYSDIDRVYVDLETADFSGQGCSSSNLATTTLVATNAKEMVKTAQLALVTGKTLRVGVNGCEANNAKITRMIIKAD